MTVACNICNQLLNCRESPIVPSNDAERAIKTASDFALMAQTVLGHLSTEHKDKPEVLQEINAAVNASAQLAAVKWITATAETSESIEQCKRAGRDNILAMLS